MDSFSDNWAYLKIELNWLERLLLTAVAKQRQETKEIEPLVKSRADRATSHWWKGIVTLDRGGYDDIPQPKRAKSSGNYQQQLHSRIRLSQEKGVRLALPMLVDRLGLSVFEKQVLLLCLAPEVHRRYSDLLGYLCQQSLPTVDLALRLFCRDDRAWRSGRSALLRPSPLPSYEILRLGNPEQPLLQRTLQLSDAWVSYLLADQPDPDRLETLIHPPVEAITPLPIAPTPIQPILPKPLWKQLETLRDRVQFAATVDEDWGLRAAQPGTIGLLVGTKGTGKTTAAHWLARELGTTLWVLDLALLTPEEQTQQMQSLLQRPPRVLLVRSAQQWFTPTPSLPHAPMDPAIVQRFLMTRSTQAGLTLLALETLPPDLPPQFDRAAILHFPIPDAIARLHLWKQAIPPSVPRTTRLPWHKLAQDHILTGAAIMDIARSAALYAAADPRSPRKLSFRHLQRAIADYQTPPEATRAID